MSFILMYDYKKCQKIITNMGNFVLALHRNLRFQVKLFFTAGCADRTKSDDIKTTGIALVVCPLLISATFRSALTQCALVWPAAQNKTKSTRVYTIAIGPAFVHHSVASNGASPVQIAPAVRAPESKMFRQKDIHAHIHRPVYVFQ